MMNKRSILTIAILGVAAFLGACANESQTAQKADPASFETPPNWLDRVSRVAQIATAEVGLADFLGRLVVPVVVIIGVKTGARTFGGNGAVHESAARGAHVERGTGKIDIAEVDTFPVDFSEAGAHEAGVAQA